MLGAVAVAPVVDKLQALREHRAHSLLTTALCRMAVHPLQRKSIKAPASLRDQRLQRGGKRVSMSGGTALVFGAVGFMCVWGNSAGVLKEGTDMFHVLFFDFSTVLIMF
jgi:hypothetical protein